ncbi:hypothetical protein OY671_009328, partial [Metschnikowia pulcherrima]
TNTANPSGRIAAGLRARNAAAKGLKSKPWVKTSSAPGSQVVAAYLENAGSQVELDKLGFNSVGFGCTTCIGNSGPSPAPISKTINDKGSIAAAVLSGNRNFEGRVSPDVRANFLASPPSVVAGASAGNLYADLSADPSGHDRNGQPVFSRDIWPDPDEIAHAMTHWRDSTAEAGDTEAWAASDAPCTPQFPWEALSAFIQPPPFFDEPRTGSLGD